MLTDGADGVRKNGRKYRRVSEEKAMGLSMVEICRDEQEQHTPVRRVKTETQIRAARLLDAWIAGDRHRLDYELSHWREGDFAAQGEDGEEGEDGREELLLCLVRQMMDEPDLFAPRTAKLHLGVWIDMLAHLARPESSLPEPLTH
jgi:hypothetical protein